MTLIVPEVHHSKILSAGFVKNMVWKASQIRSTKTLVYQMKTQWTYNRLPENKAHFMIEFFSEFFGNASVVSQGFK